MKSLRNNDILYYIIFKKFFLNFGYFCSNFSNSKLFCIFVSEFKYVLQQVIHNS